MAKETTDYYEASLQLHALYKGKLEVSCKVPVKTNDDLSVVYSPGVAEPCMVIAKYPEEARRYTIKANTIAIVSDGSSVLGLGNVGGLAALPAMEGKAMLFKTFGEMDAFPICLDTQDTDEIVGTVASIAPSFGGINLEDIAAPRCFVIEKRLKERLDIPVFHSNQHGVAVVVCAAVINAYKVLGKPLKAVRAVISGAGAAGNATAKMLFSLGVRDIVVCDSKGIIGVPRFSELNEDKLELLEFTNRDGLAGGLAEAMIGRDLFIGLSKPNVLTHEMVRTMAMDPVIFAMSEPEPEITPDKAKAAGASITGTGRADFPNHIKSVLVTPGIFRGALDAEASEITEEMKVAAAYALAGLVTEEELTEDYILPPVFKEGVTAAVSEAVSAAWKEGRIK